MTNVTVLGLGAMESRMAANLVTSGHAVTVWNRTAQKADDLVRLGALSAPTARDAVSNADVIIAMLRDDTVSRSIWLDGDTGALTAVRQGAVVVESSTLTVEWAREMGALAQAHGAGFLDACVSGTLPQVEARQLVYFVGGGATELQSARDALVGAGATQIHHVGDVGAGVAIKLATNVLLGVQTVAMAEALGILRKEGVDELRAVEIIGSAFVCSAFARGIGMMMANEAYTPMFAAELAEKDLGYAAAAGNGLSLPLISATRAVFRHAIDKGWGAENVTAVSKLYR